MIDNNFLELFSQKAILTHYENKIDSNDIKWISHGMVNLDSRAHYFTSGGVEYVLVNEDSTGDSYLADGLTHEVVLVDDGSKCIKLEFSDKKNIDGITGWYTLFKEKQR